MNILTYSEDETVYPNQYTKASARRAHCGTATDFRNVCGVVGRMPGGKTVVAP